MMEAGYSYLVLLLFVPNLHCLDATRDDKLGRRLDRTAPSERLVDHRVLETERPQALFHARLVRHRIMVRVVYHGVRGEKSLAILRSSATLS